MSALPFNRYPGAGDLPGDSRNPNSPDYVEPVFGVDDAAALVADKLVKHGHVAELVADVANARALLRWVGRAVVIPVHLRDAWNSLDWQAESLEAKVATEYEILNREDAA